ncbi:MAG: hypothetical protein K8S16_19025 [Bacteroidales bacterium]|nr:hypothetical protein [Bacteroidales bacterium]
MKKFILIILIFVGFTLTVLSQIGGEQKCTSCAENEINYKKNASALGTGNQSLGISSLTSGTENEATGMYSSAFGQGNKAFGPRSFAAGLWAYAFGGSSVALGQFVVAGSTNGIVIGSGYGQGTGEFLANGIANSLMIGCHSSKPTFFVSQSTGGVNGTGKIGIGNITAPEAKLHIKADNDEDASILLQPTGADFYAKILFGDNGHLIYGKPDGPLKFQSQDAQDFLFENGDIVQEAGQQIITDKISGSLSDKLQLFDNTNGITITNGGKVGIMNSNPLYQLSVNGNMLVGSYAQFNDNILQAANKFIETSEIKAPDVNGLKLTDQNGNGIFVDDGGNVGIGTNAPDQMLELYNGGIQLNGEYGIGFNGDIPYNGDAGYDRAKIYYDANFGGTWMDYLVIEKTDNNTSTDGGIAFTTKGSDNVRNVLMIIKGNGNVGIGNLTTSEIDSKLQVDGRIKTTQLQITDGSTNTYNHILVSDQNGVASWADPSLLDDGDWFTNSTTGDIYHTTSNVGIKTQNPVTDLDIHGDIALGMEGEKFIIHSRDWLGDKLIIAPQNSNGSWEWDNSIVLFDNGNVGIGTPNIENATAKLTVKGNILAKEVKVRIDAGGADFVFDDNYKLPGLDYIEDFINKNNHLPEIPSADEMSEKGINVGELQIKLLQKIEELTLYVIELKKENVEMKNVINEILED